MILNQQGEGTVPGGQDFEIPPHLHICEATMKLALLTLEFTFKEDALKTEVLELKQIIDDISVSNLKLTRTNETLRAQIEALKESNENWKDGCFRGEQNA